jgi:hypothetical protein
VDKVFAEVAAADLTHVASWVKDKPDCELTKVTFETLNQKGSKISDLKDFGD